MRRVVEEGTIKEFSLEMRGGSKRQKWSEKQVLPYGFDLDKFV